MSLVFNLHALVLGSWLHRLSIGRVQQALLRRLQQGTGAGLGDINVLDIARTRHAASGVHLGQQLGGGDGGRGGELVDASDHLVVKLGLVAVRGRLAGGGEIVRHQGEHKVLVLC